MKDLARKVCLVTGAATGLGKEIAKLLLDKGCKVSLLDFNEELGVKTLAGLQNLYGPSRSRFLKCDVRNESELEGLDIVVNNAGIMLNPDSAEVFAVNTGTSYAYTEKEYSSLTVVFIARQVAVFKSIQLAFKYMSKAHGYNGGHVINLASNAAITPLHTAPAYTASKHAVLGMTRSFGCDLYFNRHSIRVNCLCPGPFRSDLFCDHMEYIKASDDTASLVDDCQKQCQEPDQVAHGVVKLLEDERNGAALLCLKSVGFKYHDFPALPIA